MAGPSPTNVLSGTNNDNGKGNGLLLYFHNYSFYSQKVVMALHEKKLPFKYHLVNIIKGEQHQPWFLEINPRGEVPVLKDGVKIIPDSGRILDYLEDNFSNGGSPQLIPKDQGIEVRQRVQHFRSMLDQLPINIVTIGSFFHPDLVGKPKLPFIAPVRRMLQANGSQNLRQLAEQNPKSKDVLLHKADLLDKKHVTMTSREEVLKFLGQVDAALSEVESELASHSGDTANWWLCSRTFSLADIALTILLDRLNCLGLEGHFWTDGKRPHIDNYFKRVQNRDSYRKTIPTTLVHFQMLMKLQAPLVVGTCIAAAVAFLVGGYYFFKKQ